MRELTRRELLKETLQFLVLKKISAREGLPHEPNPELEPFERDPDEYQDFPPEPQKFPRMR